MTRLFWFMWIFVIFVVFITQKNTLAYSQRLYYKPLPTIARPGDITVALATGITTAYTYQTDLSLDYRLHERFEARINILNSTSVPITTYDLASIVIEKPALTVQAGILNFNHPSTYPSRVYLVGATPLLGGRFHFGLSQHHVSNVPSLLNYMLIGYQKTLKYANVALHFNGNALSLAIQPTAQLTQSKTPWLPPITTTYSLPYTQATTLDTRPLASLYLSKTMSLYRYFTPSEVVLLATHPWYIYPTYKASYYALKYTKDYFGDRNDGTLSNAYQHAVLNAYLAHYVASSWVHLFWEKKSKGLDWAKAIMDAHEMKGSNWDSPAGQMDLHNNAIGRSVFETHATEKPRILTLGLGAWKARIYLGTNVISNKHQLKETLRSMAQDSNQVQFIDPKNSALFKNNRFSLQAKTKAANKLLFIQTEGNQTRYLPGYKAGWSWY